MKYTINLDVEMVGITPEEVTSRLKEILGDLGIPCEVLDMSDENGPVDPEVLDKC